MGKYDDVDYRSRKYDRYEEDEYYDDRGRRRRNKYEDSAPLHYEDYKQYKSTSQISGGEIAICIVLFFLGFWPGVIFLLYILFRKR